MKVKKKNGLIEDFSVSKINTAISKSAERAMVKITPEQFFDICNHINSELKEMGYTEESTVPVAVMHMVTERALDKVLPSVGVSYREFRNYKINLVHLMDKVYKKTNAIRYIGEDVSNANTDSTMASTQRSLIYGYFNKELYMMFFLTPLERQIIEKGYLYIHDAKDRLDTINCCIFRMHDVLKGGFEMGNIWYNEPKSVDTAFDVISDVALSAASQQYGGFTIPRTDDLLEPYAQKSLDFYKNEFMKLYEAIGNPSLTPEEVEQKCDEYSYKKLERDLEQGFQGWEIKFNTVGSSRGDYPFIAISFGLNKSKLGKLINKVCLRVRKNGQGKKGFEKPVLFPKLTFLYDEELHGEGKELEDVFDDAVACSSKCMYPDFLSLTGEGYIPSMYKKYGKVVSLMGCRASLSPWYERGGIHPADEDDVPVFEGRFNLGVISLHLPMILQQSRVEGKDFYELLDYYLEIARNIHKRTFDYMGKKRASTNPLGFMQGGFLGGNLGPNDCIAPLLKPMTLSYGITALNELQQLYNQKSLVEDGEFALEVMHHINDYVDKIKEEDGLLYALYGTPSESLCFTKDTVVSCYNGNKTIDEIKVGDLVYSFNEEKRKLELKPVTFSGMTKRNAELVKVTMDNGQVVKCTPNHPFAVRRIRRDDYNKFIEGEHVTWVEAKDLKKGDRIKSNYVKVNKQIGGRPECSMYHNGRKQLIQSINAEYAYGEKPEGYVIHHKDGNKLNNEFSNLEYMLDADHRRLHLKDTIADYQFTSESQSGENNSFFGKHHTEESNRKNREAHIGRAVVVMNDDFEIVKTFECLDDAERAGYTRHSAKLACCGKNGNLGHKYKNMFWYYKDEVPEKNHKVVSVEYLEEREDVYDITVADNHNFFVGGDNGILVHNCGTQVEQFVKEYGVIENVSDRPYVSNSFHCHVTEDITPIQKQDLESRFWDLLNGGKIQYCRYPVSYNHTAIKTLIRRAMKLGFYEGVNLQLCYCEECGHEELEMTVCPKCGSDKLTIIDRMNGYLGYTKVKGKTRFNPAKNAEIKDRVSM